MYPFIYPQRQGELVVRHTLELTSSLIDKLQAPKVQGWDRRLAGWMRRMVLGSRVDERTPYFHDIPRDVVMKNLFSSYGKTEASRLHGIDPSLLMYLFQGEADHLKNVGPMSCFLPWAWDGLDKLKAVMSDKQPLSTLKVESWRKALRWIAGWFPAGSVKMSSIDEAISGFHTSASIVNAMDTSTNSCFPSYVRQFKTDDDLMTPERKEAWSHIQAEARGLYDMARRVRSHRDMPIHHVGTANQRTNVSKGPNPFVYDSDKRRFKLKRIVIAMPKGTDTLPMRCITTRLQPLMAQLVNRSNGVPLVGGWQPQANIDKFCQVMLSSADADGRIVLSGDVSNFDATLPPFVMWECALAMSKWMTRETSNLFLSIVHADVYGTSVIYPGGVIDECPSSMKSGMAITNMLDTVCNLAIQKYGEFSGYYSIHSHTCMGDDFLIEGAGVEPESVERAFADFGMVCNASKQFYEKGALNFLQRLHLIHIPGGIAFSARVAGRALSVEDDTLMGFDERTRYAFTLQLLMRLNNMCFHPFFEDTVKFFQDGDKYHLFSNLPAQTVAKLAGEYGRRKMMENAKIRNRVSSDTEFENFPVNRVSRGGSLPPVGNERYRYVYGKRFEDVPLIIGQARPI
nr:MAG: putative RNA-dependent RNA polymerase [Picobirnavirus sp.]